MYCKRCGHGLKYVFYLYNSGIICAYCRVELKARNIKVGTRWERSKKAGSAFKPRPRGMRWQEVW